MNHTDTIQLCVDKLATPMLDSVRDNLINENTLEQSTVSLLEACGILLGAISKHSKLMTLTTQKDLLDRFAWAFNVGMEQSYAKEPINYPVSSGSSPS